MFYLMFKMTLNDEMDLVFGKERKVIQINKSFYISIPPKWCRAYGIRKNSLLLMKAEKDKIIISRKEKK